MNKIVFLMTAIILNCILATTGFSSLGSKEPIHFIDVHAHYSPTGQEFAPKSEIAIQHKWTGMSVKEFIKGLDESGIDKIILSVPPTAMRKGNGHSDFGIPKLAELYPDRIDVLYGGDVFTELHKIVRKGKYKKKHNERFRSLLLEEVESGKYVGFGEIALYHIETEKRLGPAGNVPADHPWLLMLSNIAAKYDMPIDIHMEATDATMAELERLLIYNRKTKIIWDHAGWSELGMATAKDWDRLMSRHPNLYGSIKHLKLGRAFKHPNVAIRDNEGKIKQEWLRLFEKFPDRFMIGSDMKPGLFQKGNKKRLGFRHLKYMQEFLRELPEHLRYPFTKGNAIRIFNIQ